MGEITNRSPSITEISHILKGGMPRTKIGKPMVLRKGFILL